MSSVNLSSGRVLALPSEWLVVCTGVCCDRLPSYTQTVVSTLPERFHTLLAMSSELPRLLYSNSVLAAGLPPCSLLAFSLPDPGV